MRRIPIVATIVVLAAVATMILLGFWQLDRKEQKEALLARYAAAADNPAVITEWPGVPELLLYRRMTFACADVVGWRAISGRNSRDDAGYVHVAQCRSNTVFGFDGPGYVAEVVVGWSRDPNEQPIWQGGEVTGTIAPGGELGWRLVADPPVGGLEANALPDPNNIPNNHLAYAGQWFFFAFTALLIYALALRRRWKVAEAVPQGE